MKTIKLKCECSYTIAGQILDDIASKISALGEDKLLITTEIGANIYDVTLIGHKSFVDVEIKLMRTFDDVYNDVYERISYA